MPPDQVDKAKAKSHFGSRRQRLSAESSGEEKPPKPISARPLTQAEKDKKQAGEERRSRAESRDARKGSRRPRKSTPPNPRPGMPGSSTEPQVAGAESKKVKRNDKKGAARAAPQSLAHPGL